MNAIEKLEMPNVITQMDVVDAQIHMGPGRIEETLAAMNALGIRAVLIDEYWLPSLESNPHHKLPDGVIRPVCPTAELAAQTYPERFSWVLRVNRRDPEYAYIIRIVRDAPHGRALRLDPGMSAEETQLFGKGGYDHILSAASDCGLPVFIFLPDQLKAFARCAQKFPNLRIIVDHCGIASNMMREHLLYSPVLSLEQQMALFDEVLALSDFPNVALKWGHASEMFETPVFPGEELRPILRKVISRFGAERVMWASDYSTNMRGESWGELLFGVKGNPDLSSEERAAVLGETLRTWLNWPA